jgi:hypothetical protein
MSHAVVLLGQSMDSRIRYGAALCQNDHDDGESRPLEHGTEEGRPRVAGQSPRAVGPGVDRIGPCANMKGEVRSRQPFESSADVHRSPQASTCIGVFLCSTDNAMRRRRKPSTRTRRWVISQNAKPATAGKVCALPEAGAEETITAGSSACVQRYHAESTTRYYHFQSLGKGTAR